MQLTHARIVITGAASGIGRALLDRLAEQQVELLAADQNQTALTTACRELAGRPASILPLPVDLSSRAGVDHLFSQALRLLGRIDLFIANAGFAYYEVLSEPDWDHLERLYQVNVFNPLYSLEKMAALYGEAPWKVVITASAMAHIAVPGYAAYSSTKAALDRFADAYRWQMKDPRKLMLVYPIATRTGFFQAAGRAVPTPWPSQTPEAVAQAVLAGIRRDRQRVYPSRLFQAILALKRILPLHWLVQRLEQRRLDRWLRDRQGMP